MDPLEHLSRKLETLESSNPEFLKPETSKPESSKPYGPLENNAERIGHESGPPPQVR